MPESSEKNTFAYVDEVLGLMRYSFSTNEAIHYLVALVFLRWFINANRDVDELPLNLRLPPGLRYRPSDWMHEADLGHWCNDVLAQLETLNRRELGGVFVDLDFASSRFVPRHGRDGILHQAVALVWSGWNSRPESKRAQAYVLDLLALVRDYRAAERGAACLNTPPALCTLAARLLQPSARDRIYDPACGTGQMLVDCAVHAAQRGDETVKLFGGERDLTGWALAKLTAITHGYSSEYILLGDSLRQGNFFSAGEKWKFDVVVSHPPWGMKDAGTDYPPERYRQFRWGIPPKNNADFAFILHMVSTLDERWGRMAAIVSTGVLSRSGAEAAIRQRLLEDNLVDGVIALPEKMFQGTAVAGAILVLRMMRREKDVLFIDARGMAESARNKKVFSAATVNYIAQIFATRANLAGVSTVVPSKNVAVNDCSLSVPLYVRPLTRQTGPDINEIQQRRCQIAAELAALNSRIEELLNSVFRSAGKRC